MDANRLKEIAIRYAPAVLAGLVLGLLLMALLPPPRSLPQQQPPGARQAGGNPGPIIDRALVSVREQGQLTPLTARYVAVVSSTESSLGLEARKTLVLPAEVTYGLDLARLRREHLSWDAATGTLSIQLPPLEISSPNIDMSGAREFREGGVLMALTGSEQELDQENLRLAQQDLLRQARDAPPLTAARGAAMRAVARAFALPLRAAGIEASVSVRFVDPEGRDEAVHLDRPGRVEDFVRDRQAGDAPPIEGNQGR